MRWTVRPQARSRSRVRGRRATPRASERRAPVADDGRRVTVPRVQLTDMTWPEVADRPLLCIPVGSCEQHGPHLPLHTDTIVAEALAARLAASRADVVVGPSLTVTASGEHAGFPGTLSLG